MLSTETVMVQVRHGMADSDTNILYVWPDPEGGTSRWWTGPLVNHPMLMFGRHGQGYSPFGRMDAKGRSWAEESVDCLRQRGHKAELRWNEVPPDDACGDEDA